MAAAGGLKCGPAGCGQLGPDPTLGPYCGRFSGSRREQRPLGSSGQHTHGGASSFNSTQGLGTPSPQIRCVQEEGGIPGGASDKEHAFQCRRIRRLGLDPWVKKIPWRRAWQPMSVFLPGESRGRGAWRAQPRASESDTPEATGHSTWRKRLAGEPEMMGFIHVFTKFPQN